MNRYGVGLEMFPTAQRHDSDKEFTLLFFGSWTLQKGRDLLVSAVAEIRECGSFMSDQLAATWLFRQEMRALSIWIPCRRRNSRGSMLRPTLLYWPRGRTALGSCWLRHLPADFRSSAPIVPAGPTPAHAGFGRANYNYTPRRFVCAYRRDCRIRDRHKAGECLSLLADPDRETLSWRAYGRRYAEQIATDFGECSCASLVPNDYAIVSRKMERATLNNRPLRSVHVIAGLDPAHGGPSCTVPRLCAALAMAGAKSRLLSVGDDGRRALHDDGGRCFARIGRAFLLCGDSSSSGLTCALRELAPKVDVIHITASG